MKPRNREITIFNLSMLDVISGAVGAFLIITVVLFPSYARNVRIGEKNLEEFKKVRERLAAELDREKQKPHPDWDAVEKKHQRLEQALAALRQQQEEAKQDRRVKVRPATESKLGPVLVAAFGNTGYDVEVAVLPELPGVPAFDPKKKRRWRDPSHYAGTPPRVDKEGVPEARLLLVPRPIPGVSYRIYYKLARSARKKEQLIRGELSYANKTWKLPVPSVAAGRGAFVGSFQLDHEGSLFFSAPNQKMHKAFRNLNGRLLGKLQKEPRKKPEDKRASDDTQRERKRP